MDQQESNNGEPSPKRQKHNNNTDAPQPRSITNICYDVLERIFEFLDIESFLNVANTCKRLQIAAIAKFHDDHRNKQINLDVTRYSRISYSANDKDINVAGLKYCLPFLRCFGAKCTILSITTSHDAYQSQHNDYVDQYITKYCADTLKSIRFVEKPSFKKRNFPRPFKSVTDVYIGHMNLRYDLPLIGNLFPNAHHLVMYSLSIDKDSTAVSFPHLEDLAMNDCKNFTMTGLLNLLHANRQLKKFQLQVSNQHEPMTMSVLSNMIAENPSITKFWISSRYEIPVTTNELSQFANERSAMIDLDLPRYVISVEDAVQFIRQLHSLKRFSFKLRGRTEYDRLVEQLGNEWKYRHIYHIDHPSYPLNNVVILTR